MSSLAARLWQQQQLAYFPHTNVSGDTWQLYSKGITTGAGAAGGTTIVDTNADSGGANTLNGQYWVRILPGQGTLDKQWKRIIDDDGSGTLTLEGNGFGSQVAGSVAYEIWKSPEPVFVVTSAASGTSFTCSARTDEVDDYWIGWYLVPVGGTNSGINPVRITDSTQATGAITVASGLTQPVAGDVFVVRKFIEATAFNPTLSEEYVPRPQQRVTFSRADGVVGPRGGTVALTMQVVGSGTLAAAASKANCSILGGLLEAAGLEETIGTSTAVGTGSTTTSIVIATGTGENFYPGMMVVYNGNPTFVTAITDGGGSDDTLTVSPALPVAPTAAATLYASRMYQRSTDGDTRGVGFEYEIDGVRYTITGCRGNVSFNDGPVIEAAFTFTMTQWIREIEAASYVASAAYTTAAPVLSSERLCWMDATSYEIGQFTTSPNTKSAIKGVQSHIGINGNAGVQITDFGAGGSFRHLVASGVDEIRQDEVWLSRTSRALKVAMGNGGSMIGFNVPACRLVQSPHPENADGVMDLPEVFEAHDAGTTTYTTGTVKQPDYVVSLT